MVVLTVRNYTYKKISSNMFLKPVVVVIDVRS